MSKKFKQVWARPRKQLQANVILAIVDYFGSDSMDGHNSTVTSPVHCFFKKNTTEFKHTCVLADCHEYFILQRGLTRARPKTRSSRKTRKPRRISFPRFSTLSFPFCTILKTEKSELKTSEICSEVVSSNSEVLWSNSEVFQLRLFHFALHSKRKTRR